MERANAFSSYPDNSVLLGTGVIAVALMNEPVIGNAIGVMDAVRRQGPTMRVWGGETRRRRWSAAG